MTRMWVFVLLGATWVLAEESCQTESLSLLQTKFGPQKDDLALGQVNRTGSCEYCLCLLSAVAAGVTGCMFVEKEAQVLEGDDVSLVDESSSGRRRRRRRRRTWGGVVNTVGGGLESAGNAVVGGVSGVASDAWNGVTECAGNVVDCGKTIGEWTVDAASTIGDGIVCLANNMVNIKMPWGECWNYIKGEVKKGINAFNKGTEGILDALVGGLQSMKKLVLDGLDKMFEYLSKKAEEFVNIFLDWLDGMARSIGIDIKQIEPAGIQLWKNIKDLWNDLASIKFNTKGDPPPVCLPSLSFGMVPTDCGAFGQIFKLLKPTLTPRTAFGNILKALIRCVQLRGHMNLPTPFISFDSGEMCIPNWILVTIQLFVGLVLFAVEVLMTIIDAIIHAITQFIEDMSTLHQMDEVVQMRRENPNMSHEEIVQEVSLSGSSRVQDCVGHAWKIGLSVGLGYTFNAMERPPLFSKVYGINPSWMGAFAKHGGQKLSVSIGIAMINGCKESTRMIPMAVLQVYVKLTVIKLPPYTLLDEGFGSIAINILFGYCWGGYVHFPFRALGPGVRGGQIRMTLWSGVVFNVGIQENGSKVSLTLSVSFAFRLLKAKGKSVGKAFNISFSPSGPKASTAGNFLKKGANSAGKKLKATPGVVGSKLTGVKHFAGGVMNGVRNAFALNEQRDDDLNEQRDENEENDFDITKVEEIPLGLLHILGKVDHGGILSDTLANISDEPGSPSDNLMLAALGVDAEHARAQASCVHAAGCSIDFSVGIGIAWAVCLNGYKCPGQVDDERFAKDPYGYQSISSWWSNPTAGIGFR